MKKIKDVDIKELQIGIYLKAFILYLKNIVVKANITVTFRAIIPSKKPSLK